MLTIIGSLTADPTKTGLIALNSFKTPPHPTAAADGTESKKTFFDATTEENHASPEDQDDKRNEKDEEKAEIPLKEKKSAKVTKEAVATEATKADEESTPARKEKA
ncbi:hypothetical protein BC830DRAFT_1165558 [Chytriomyces sp. MP71]|nr:hypothetical protein BC830DRAFT_1165558 [Chytriomyces sp. MP71]